MRIFALSALVCGLAFFAACGGESTPDKGTEGFGSNDNPVDAGPPPADATETIMLDISWMT